MSLRPLLERAYEWYLRRRQLHIPMHIAIIQDGNRRFARDRGIPIPRGHAMGADTTEQVLEWARELGLRYITLFCFSTENFNRSTEEVKELMALFKEKLDAVAKDGRVHRNGIKVRMLGDRGLLPPDLLSYVERAEEATRHYNRYFINLALAYGGRNEIVQAARSILSGVREGRIRPEEIDSSTVERYLNEREHIPPVDLIIRTGNERRTSNFLPWQANGNECAVYFCAPNWPDFRKIDLLRAIRVYDQRVRMIHEFQNPRQAFL